jgi:hypothetical protein
VLNSFPLCQVCTNVAPQNAGNFAAPETFASVGIDQRWTPERFAEQLKISVVERSADTLKLYAHANLA